MEVFKGIKEKFGNYFLEKEREGNRITETRNFELATSVGIIFSAESESDFILVKQYRKHLQSKFGIKDVNAIGWMNLKELPDYTSLNRGITFLKQSDVNWYFKPQGEEYKEFISTPFDILIDLTFDAILPLRFILKKSVAKMKVGQFSEEDYKLYDVTFNLKENALLDEYIRQTDKYLNLIKP